MNKNDAYKVFDEYNSDYFSFAFYTKSKRPPFRLNERSGLFFNKLNQSFVFARKHIR